MPEDSIPWSGCGPGAGRSPDKVTRKAKLGGQQRPELNKTVRALTAGPTARF